MKFIISIIALLLMSCYDLKQQAHENFVHTIKSVESYNNSSNEIVFEYTVNMYADGYLWSTNAFYSITDLELSVGDTITLSKLINNEN